MTNINDRTNNPVSNQPDSLSNRDAYDSGYVHGRVEEQLDTRSHNKAANDAFVRGRLAEKQRYEKALEARDNENAGRGLLLGFLLTGLVGAVAYGIFFVTQQNQKPTQPIQILNPPPASPSPATKPPEVQKQIIERVVPVPQKTVEIQPVPVPVPQETAQPSATTPTQPEVAPPSAPAEDALVPPSNPSNQAPASTTAKPTGDSDVEQPTDAGNVEASPPANAPTPANETN
jgi:hypothetical protein